MGASPTVFPLKKRRILSEKTLDGRGGKSLALYLLPTNFDTQVKYISFACVWWCVCVVSTIKGLIYLYGSPMQEFQQ